MAHLPLHAGRQRHAIPAHEIRRIGACRRPYKATPEVRTKSPLLLTEGGTALAVTGVEGTIYDFSDCPERR